MPRINADELDLQEQVIRTNKVQKTHKGGRSLSWNVLVAVGDRNGHVGVGLGKAGGIPDAIRKAIEDAKKQIIEVPLVGSTIPHEIEMPYGAALVRMKPASPGTGVVAGGAVRPILELAGIRDVLAKSLGSPNAINTARATVVCLKSLKVADRVAEIRGRSLNELVPWLVKKREEEEALAPAAETAEEEESVEAEAEADSGSAQETKETEEGQ
jgi:small subunit ribosomal protein S5